MLQFWCLLLILMGIKFVGSLSRCTSKWFTFCHFYNDYYFAVTLCWYLAFFLNWFLKLTMPMFCTTVTRILLAKFRLFCRHINDLVFSFCSKNNSIKINTHFFIYRLNECFDKIASIYSCAIKMQNLRHPLFQHRQQTISFTMLWVSRHP